ncbi:MAG: hypothetical protein QM831_11020 [Kofleriaceae bacterium]
MPILLALLGGCFYSEEINQRPSLDIHQTGDPVYRTATVHFNAVGVDPDGDSIAYVWRAYACTSSDKAPVCDQAPFQTGASSDFAATLPSVRIDSPDEFDTLHITLDGHDSYGANSRPTQTLDLALVDQAPTVELRKDPRHAYVVNTPVNVYALLSDFDDPAAALPIVWSPFGPSSDHTHDGETLTDPATLPAPPNYTKVFKPTMNGLWTIRVSTQDPSGMPASADLPIQVDADHAPCLAQWAPTATTIPNTTIPLTDPTLFQIQVVTDDLDPYPSVPNDPILGTTEFHWSIVPPGGTRQQLTSVTGNAVPLDPATYRPGDIVELRVEIQDRNHTPVNCPESDLTCSVISDNSCLQRLTWRAEVR